MPELPDVMLYRNALHRFIVGQTILRVIIRSPFVVRTFEPPPEALEGAQPIKIDNLGKRIVWIMSNGLVVVTHLMIAGRYHWKKPGTLPSQKRDLMAFQFSGGTLMLTEASAKHRASLHLFASEHEARQLDPGGVGLDQLDATEFGKLLRKQNRTVKRALCDPKLFCGIGNAYSDEILFEAKISPVIWTTRLTDNDCDRLLEAARKLLAEWTARLLNQTGDRFPEKVTAFRPEMNVHGKFGQPCTRCGSPVQRIVYAERETNYCARCQNNGKVLADRSLSRLLKGDWPRDIEAWES